MLQTFIANIFKSFCWLQQHSVVFCFLKEQAPFLFLPFINSTNQTCSVSQNFIANPTWLQSLLWINAALSKGLLQNKVFKNVTLLMRSARVLGAGDKSLFLQRYEMFVVYSELGQREGWKILLLRNWIFVSVQLNWGFNIIYKVMVWGFLMTQIFEMLTSS